jgi:general secretion pathway protein K
MKLPRPDRQRRRGIALIIVMIVIVVFAILAAGLAYSMKVETKLARNSSWDTELEWLGRSGIELAKYVLSQSGQGGQQYDALNQKWAGGTGETNDALAAISLTDNQLGHGRFSVKIIDADRKFNINLAVQQPDVLNQGLILMGIEATESPHLVAAIQDWIDRDDNVTAGGQDTESSFYRTLRPPYEAKNGPIDDLTELMMIKGVTPAMYFGSGGGGTPGFRGGIRVLNQRRGAGQAGEEPSYPVGFVDLFTAISGRHININTASATVMQLIPDVDGNMAQAIIQARNGPDGAEGNEDDMPFRSVGELAGVPGMTPQVVQMFSRVFATRSSTFEVQVEASIDQYKRTYHAVLRRVAANQILLLYMYWE